VGVAKSQSQIIDGEAIKIVKNLFPDADWTIYDVKPDTGIDHPLEIVEAGKHTSKTIDLQIKGHQRLKKIEKGKYVSQRLECEHLDSYLKKRRPVFLIVVDTATGECFWLFIHEYADTVLKNGDWRRKLVDGSKEPHVSIRVPTANSLKDLKRFRRAIENSLGYLDERLIPNGIRYAEDTLSSLDPRIAVKLNVSATEKHYALSAKEPVSFGMSFKEGFLKSGKFDQLIGRGLPVSVIPGEIEVSGSPLFQHLLDQAAKNAGKLHVVRKQQGTLILRRETPEGVIVGREWPISAVFQGGTSEFRITAVTHNGMFALSTTIRSGAAGPNALDMNIKFSQWYGRSILDLPYFDEMQAIFGHPDEPGRLAMSMEIDGLRTGIGTLRRDNDMYLSIGDFIELIGQGRYVASHFRVNPIVHSLSDDDKFGILVMFAIATGKEVRATTGVATVDCIVPKDHATEFIQTHRDTTTTWQLSNLPSVKMPFLGLNLDLGPVKSQASHMKLSSNLKEISKQFDNGASEVLVTFVSTERTEVSLKPPNPEAIEAFARTGTDASPGEIEIEQDS
jgi:Domain of unknown function (DUF4365)